MKAKKLTALLACLLAAFVLLTFSAFAEEETCTEHKFETVKYSQTCTTEGRYDYKCVTCGYSYSEPIPMHNFNYIYTREYPTCSKTGIDVVYCDWCNMMDEVVTAADSNAHNYGEWVVTEEPTCSQPGEKKRECGNPDCGFVDVVEIPADESKHVPKAGTQQIIPPSCYEDGVEKNVCEKCDQLYSTPIPVHSDFETNTAKYTLKKDIKATCAVPASKTYLCECGESFTVVGSLDPDAHDYPDESEWHYTEGASCKHPGKYMKICRNSPYHIVEGEYAPHIYEGVTEIVKAPKCNESGLKTTKCIYCDEVKEEVIPAEHTITGWVITSGSCAEGGTATGKCSCGAKEETITFSAGTHLNYDAEKALDKKLPTCINSGYLYVTCLDCQKNVYVFPEGYAARGSHLAGEWKTVVPASCTQSGEEELYCDICNAVMEKKVILQKEHSCIILQPGFAATCTENGMTDLLFCSMCEATFKQETIEAKGHSFVDQIAGGEGAARICEVCFEYEVGSVSCNCFCHNSSGLAKGLWKIVMIFCRIFGMNLECKCGVPH